MASPMQTVIATAVGGLVVVLSVALGKRAWAWACMAWRSMFPRFFIKVADTEPIYTTVKPWGPGFRLMVSIAVVGWLLGAAAVFWLYWE